MATVAISDVAIPTTAPATDSVITDDSVLIENKEIPFQSTTEEFKVDEFSPSNSDALERTVCALCNRKFLSDRISKHIEICQKLASKKRKQFNSTKQRSENQESGSIGKPTASSSTTTQGNRGKKVPAPKAESNESVKKTNWRSQHAEFIRAIRAARGEPVPEPGPDEIAASNAIPPGMTECPCCSRRFSVKAADRHIQWCQEKAQNNHRRKQSASNQEAMERMKARTKYKPPSVNNGSGGPNSTISRPNSKSVSPSRIQQQQQQQPSRRTSTSTTDTSRTNSTNSRLSLAPRTISRQQQQQQQQQKMPPNTQQQRGGQQSRTTVQHPQRTISKSTGNLSSRSPSRATNNASRASTTNNDLGSSASSSSVGRLNRRQPNQQTITVRRNIGRPAVQAKVNTGLSHSKSSGALAGSGSGGSRAPAAPVMKFKEKFPHHQYQHNSTIDYDILRKNSTYDDSPKTVPGVRTGGISPTKNEPRSPSMSKSELNLDKIDDIKKRIDMYISGIYDNDLLQRFGGGTMAPPGTTTTLANGALHYNEADDYEDGRGTVNIERSASAHSVMSARGSTSDSSDSGLGSHPPPHGLSKEAKTQRNELFSPSMSELEGNLKMSLRNGSLNDIQHLLNDQKDSPDGEAEGENHSDENPMTESMTPRFCHTCGTKYPNALAKFCYECGAKRFATYTS